MTSISNADLQFKNAIQAAGITPPDHIFSDGKIHRFSANGRRGDDAGWYVFHGDNIPAGSFGNWRTDTSCNWRADIGRGLTSEEEEACRVRIAEMQREREAAEAKRKKEAKIKANESWNEATPAIDYPYLTRKGIKSHGARVSNGKLLVPLYDESREICSLQFIDANGSKKFLTDGQVKGCYSYIGAAKGAKTLCVTEGFATGASVNEATGYPVIIAFNAGKLVDAARFARQKLPNARIIVCADDDYRTDGNPGVTKATEAAQAIGGRVAIPDFGDDRPEGSTDFNDLHKAQGLDDVKRCLENAVEPVIKWPSPESLVKKLQPEPYPDDALPDSVLAAVREVHNYVKAPFPLIASSALSAISLAVQAFVDVKRAERLESPTGLFFLTIADSGERKTTCDGYFTEAIREYERKQREKNKGRLEDYEADATVWSSKYKGVGDAIRTAAKGGKPTEELEGELKALQLQKPEPPKIPRAIYTDVTPEELAYSLSKRWPAGGIMSSEGGAVFGSHGMGKDSVMRNLSLLNQLWDGGTINIDRKTSESFTVKGARLSMALQIQEATLRDFFDRSGELARGTGFLARFLIAWPESTQGNRPFSELSSGWPALSAFNNRIKEILNRSVSRDEDGGLSPTLLELTPNAKKEWISFYNEIELRLKPCGELYDVRDVASKAADNVTRLAALFQYFEDQGHVVEEKHIVSAGAIVAWHLSESRRFFGELSLPSEITDAIRLDKWLIEYCKLNRTLLVDKNHARQCSPLRKKDRLNNAIEELVNLNRIRTAVDGKKITIRVNPGLVQ